ncbi:hypothetical protein DBA29_12960 [Xenophilus aerolatus]|nr:hypothetical protein [Xenophilus aerolatus]
MVCERQAWHAKRRARLPQSAVSAQARGGPASAGGGMPRRARSAPMKPMKPLSGHPLAAALLCCTLAGAADRLHAQVINPNVCPGGTLYGSRDPGAYSGFSSARDVVQADCTGNIAGGAESMAGIDLSSGNTALGRSARASGGSATAIGSNTQASAGSSLAAGNVANASGNASIAIGYRSVAEGERAVASGADASATGQFATASGTRSAADGERAVAIGADASAAGQFATALGTRSQAREERSTALGADSDARAYDTTALGSSARAVGIGGLAAGYAAYAFGENGVALGRSSQAYGAQSIAIGWGAFAGGSQSMAFGTGSSTTGAGSVALGAGSSDDGRSNVVSLGSSGSPRTLTNVANIEASGQVSAASLGVAGTAFVGGRLVTQGGIDNRGAGIANAGRISGVTAGELSATSTDAVNGAQLYGVRSTAEQALSLATNQGAQVIDMTQQLNTQGSQIQAQSVQLQAHSVQLQAIVNGQLGVCTVDGGALRCSVAGRAAATANGEGATAVGIGASAQGDGAQAFGRQAQALHAGSLAIGDGARALGDPTVAIGAGSLASGSNAVALGANAQALAPNSVALGQGSIADRPASVSVGSADAPRQITNVAPGTAPTDAVNRAQLDTAGAQLAARLTSQFSTDLQGVRDLAARGVAQAMAMPSVPGLQAGRRWIGAAMASYAGQNALGLGFAYQLDTNWQVGGGLSVATGSGSQVGARVQAAYQW